MDIEGAEIGVLMKSADDQLIKIGQITVEFHDFLNDGNVTVGMVVEARHRLQKLGFQSFKMSHRTNGDVLFVNKSLIRVNRWQSLVIQVQGRWLAGINRVLKRTFQMPQSL